MNLLKSMLGPAIPNLTPQEAQARLQAKPAPFLLDVRQPEEFRQERVAGAKLIPLGELPRRLNELPKDRDILVICQSGSRSSGATRQLVTAGYSAFNIRGGLMGWQFAGLPIQRK